MVRRGPFVIVFIAAMVNAIAGMSYNDLLNTDIFWDGLDDKFGLSRLSERDSNAVLNTLSLVLNSVNIEQIYKNYKVAFNVSEVNFDGPRKKIFTDNLLKIAEHNLLFSSNEVAWKKDVTKFTIMSDDEIEAGYLNHIPANFSAIAIPLVKKNVTYFNTPESFDWRNQGGVTVVKNQRHCGSCTLFAATACLESYYSINQNLTLDLGEQELLDCPEGPGIGRCKGNAFDPVFQYLQDFGVSSEAEYPYIAKYDPPCKREGKSRAGRVPRWMKLPSNEENYLQSALITNGPIAVSLKFRDIASYSSGIFDGTCGGSVNHALLLVGYGEEGEKKYWTIKNSWDSEWGEKGFFRLQRNAGNLCGIREEAFQITA